MLYRPEEIHLKQRTTTCRNIAHVTCLLFLSNAPEYLFSRWILLVYCIFIPKTSPSIGILDGGVYDVALHEPHVYATQHITLLLPLNLPRKPLFLLNANTPNYPAPDCH